MGQSHDLLAQHDLLKSSMLRAYLSYVLAEHAIGNSVITMEVMKLPMA